jgi:hypothetical protein
MVRLRFLLPKQQNRLAEHHRWNQDWIEKIHYCCELRVESLSNDFQYG